MSSLLLFLARRFRPAVGWPLALLAYAAAAGPALAAQSASLRLPAGLLAWAGLLGAALGLRLAGRRGKGWRLLYAAAAAALGAVLLVAAVDALPPAGLLWQDARALAAHIAARLEGAAPELLTPRFLELSLPRGWGGLLAAPAGGEAGAALLIATASLAATWLGAFALGWAVGAGRSVFAWGLPLTAALSLTAVLGGSRGASLILGLAAILGLAVAVTQAVRERSWTRAGADYSDELRWEVYGWGGALVAAALIVAVVLPTSLPRLPSPLPAAPDGLPSGLAAIERRVEGAGPGPRAAPDPTLSTLPAVTLGTSLVQGDPEALALRIRLEQPLPPGPWPRYWRARVLNVYNGRAWTASARVGPLEAPLVPLDGLEGAVVQEVELVGRRATTLVALPDLVDLDVEAQVERLPDGALAAVTVEEGVRRYTAVSRAQEQAPPLVEVQDRLPYSAETLALPAGVPPRVAELGRSIVAGASDPLARALAIEAYLRGLPYAYEVEPLPAGGDAVDQFLFEMGRGYCTYYASAMVILARTQGIPARVAVGYATGSYDEESRTYLVREGEAHAWPELFIGGRWLPFEPTPVRPLPARGSPGEMVPPPLPEPADVPEPASAPMALWPWALAAAACGLAVAALWLGARRVGLSPLARAQLRLERLGEQAGVPWPAGATLHEYAALLEARGVGRPEAVRALVGLVEAARYSGRPLDEQQRQALREAARGLRGRRRGA
jgi:transglutaminase-like putative cysteine protease